MNTLHHDIENFLAHSIQLESEAARRFGELADAMQSAGNRPVARLFRRLADYSLLHLQDARARAAYRQLPALKAEDFSWPGLESPEAAAIWAADPQLGPEQALQVALQAETSGRDFYQQVLDATTDPEIRALAREFVDEESAHALELQRWVDLQRAGLPLPVEG